MSEGDDATRDTDADPEVARARRRWVKWLLPVTIFVLIAAFTLAAMFVRDLDPGPAPVTADPEPAQHLNTRAWRTIAADPDAHARERIILWGQVTAYAQTADPSTFRANVDAARHQPKGGRVDYPTAVVLRGTPQTLSPLATGYIFKAEVTVDGAAPPEAAPGAAATPRLTVTRLTVTDRTVG